MKALLGSLNTGVASLQLRGTGVGSLAQQKPFFTGDGGKSTSSRGVQVQQRRSVQPQSTLTLETAPRQKARPPGGLVLPGFSSFLATGQPTRFDDPESGLPAVLHRLTDPNACVELDSLGSVPAQYLNNRELDKLVAALGRNKSTWQRALQLYEWLLTIGHLPDDRLCTTLIRVCSQHGQAQTALQIYDWMRSPLTEGGAQLTPTVYTYTAAMRAALTGNMVDRALQVWDDALIDGCEADCRMCTTLVEVCTRKGDTLRALRMYDHMQQASADARMAPTVHAYTAAMRAAAEGGAWEAALRIWGDMQRAGCRPTGHAYAAVISACAAGREWQRAVQLFDEMTMRWSIKPDVVSCTALITALGADAQWERAEQVVHWMTRSAVKPNVRTYTALITALANGQQWGKALELVRNMRQQGTQGSVEPNAYTYSALIKAMGEQGQWQAAERLFQELEAEAQVVAAPSPPAAVAGVSWSGQHGDASVEAWQRLMLSNAAARASTPIAIPGIAAAAGSEAAAAGHRLEQRRSSDSFGDVPKHIAEQVLDSPPRQSSLASTLPDNLPGQSNLSTPDHFSLFSSRSAATPAASSGSPGSVQSAWQQQQPAAPVLESHQQQQLPLRALQQRCSKGPVNEVVCGAMMSAYERSGRFEQCIGLLDRALKLGIPPNTIMYNTAISACGKAGMWQQAEELFRAMPEPDNISCETLIAAFSMSGQAAQAEKVFEQLLAMRHTPHDYAFVGLIAAHSMAGNWKAAMAVHSRMQRMQLQPSLHVYNALLAACDRAGQLQTAIELQKQMRVEGLQGNFVTHSLLQNIGSAGIAQVEKQQTAAAALSAVLAAAGAAMVRLGMF